MVTTLILAMAMQAASPQAAAPSEFALICRMAGVLSPDNSLAAFPQPRLFGALIRPTGDTFTPVRTFDPTRLLGGHDLALFHRRTDHPDAYGAATGRDVADSGTYQVTYDPRPTASQPNQWQAAIAPTNAGASLRPIVGLCLKLDGMSEEEFQYFTSSVGGSQ